MAAPQLPLAVVGCGKVAQWAHLPAIAKTPSVRLVALCDADVERAERVAKRFGVEHWSSDPDAILSDPRIAAVVVAVPDPSHVELTRRALEAEKHVLVEKPLGQSVEECISLRELVARTELKVQVGAMKRHDPGLQYAKRFIDAELGAIGSCQTWYRASTFKDGWHATMAPPPIEAGETPSPDEHKRDRERYYLATHGAHLFDLIRFLAGDARLRKRLSHHAGRDAHLARFHELAAGGLVNFELVVSVPAPWSEGVAIYGEAGNVNLDIHFPFLLRASDVRTFEARSQQWTEPVFSDTDPYKRQLEAFARAVTNDLSTSPDLEDGIAALELIEAVHRASSTDARVPLRR